MPKVRENRAQREAERQRQQREREARRDAREEAKRRVQREETRKKTEVLRQEKMLQQEMVRLRREMDERRRVEQLVRQRYPLLSLRVCIKCKKQKNVSIRAIFVLCFFQNNSNKKSWVAFIP